MFLYWTPKPVSGNLRTACRGSRRFDAGGFDACWKKNCLLAPFAEPCMDAHPTFAGLETNKGFFTPLAAGFSRRMSEANLPPGHRAVGPQEQLREPRERRRLVPTAGMGELVLR